MESEQQERSLGLDEGAVAPEAETDEADAASETTVEDQPKADEESPEAIKERAAKAEEERDRYKKDLLALKNSKRQERRQRPEADIEAKVEAVLHKKNERSVLRKVVDEKSPLYLPELVDDRQYREIVGYLPRNIDRSSEDGIHKALKIAVSSWRADRGGSVDKAERKEDVAAEVARSETKPGGGGSQAAAKPSGRKLLKPQQDFGNWYKKPSN